MSEQTQNPAEAQKPDAGKPDNKPKAEPAKKPEIATAAPLGAARPLVQLRVDQWSYEGARFGRHEVTPDTRTTRADLVLPEYWANIAAKLKPGARIEAHWEDGSAFGEYYVRRRHGNFVEVFELSYTEFPGMAAIPSHLANYKVEYAGTVAQWRVVRVSDKRVLKDKFADEFSAGAWLRQQPWARAA